MFDRLWPVLQHGLLLLLPAVGGVLIPWASSELVPALGTIDPRYATLATAIISLIALLITPLTAKYGVIVARSVTAPENSTLTAERGSDPNA